MPPTRGSPNNPYPLDRMAADLVGYINQVKSGTAGKVKVGTRLVGVIAPDAPFQTIARACDVVQVNIHPGEFAAAGNNIIPTNTIGTHEVCLDLRMVERLGITRC